jgi:fucose 4-O-acetylase-like acetyltransferase
MKQRLIQADFIKGIAIILVVYGHINHIGTYGDMQNQFDEIIYSFHIPIFLIISGYFFHVSRVHKEQITSLIKKIGVPYLIFISFYLIGLLTINTIGIETSNKAPTSLLSFANTVIFQPYGTYWFLHSLIIINITLVGIDYLVKKANIFLFYVFSFIVFFFLDLLEIVTIKASIYFMLGFILKQLITINTAEFKIIGTHKKDLKIPSYAFMIFLPICLFLFMQDDIYNFGFLQILNCVIIFSLLWLLSDYFKKSRLIKLISWIGQNTLIILLFHLFFLTAFKPLKGLFLNIDASGISYSILVTLLTVGLCVFFSKIFDILKISKYLFGVNYIYRTNKQK